MKSIYDCQTRHESRAVMLRFKAVLEVFTNEQMRFLLTVSGIKAHDTREGMLEQVRARFIDGVSWTDAT